MSREAQYRRLEGCGIWVPAGEPAEETVSPLTPRDADVSELVEDVIVDLRTVRKVFGLGRLLCGALTVMVLCAIWPVASFDVIGLWPAHGRLPRSAPGPRASAAPSERAEARAVSAFLAERRRSHDLVRLALVLVPADLEVHGFELAATPGGTDRSAALTVGVEATSEQPGPAIAYAASLDALGGAATATSAPASAEETSPVTTYRIAAQIPAEPWEDEVP